MILNMYKYFCLSSDYLLIFVIFKNILEERSKSPHSFFYDTPTIYNLTLIHYAL